MKKTIFYIILCILWMGVIFNFSSKNSNQSNGSSKKLIYNCTSLYEKIFNKDIDKEMIIKKFNNPVRKLAHYSIYFLLGILVYKLFMITRIKKKEILAIIICTLYAITDEFHQLFVSGRSGQLRDILIDCLGSITVIILIKIIMKIKENKLQRISE